MTCSVCLDLYRNPVILPCSHSFCRQCIDGILKCGAYSTFFDCPSCRTLVVIPSKGLPENIALRNIVAAFQKQKMSAAKATPLMPCIRHSREELAFFCSTCQKAVCEICASESHEKHSVDYIDHVVEEEKV